MTTTPPAYAELHCLSNLSFLRGAAHPEVLVEQAAELGYTALALTDECSISGVVRAHVAAKEHNIQLIVGSEFRLQDDMKLLVLPKDRLGYGDLCELISLARGQAEKGQYHLQRDNLLGLRHCLLLWIPQADQSGDARKEQAAWLKQRFGGRCWLVMELLGESDDRRWLRHCQSLGRRHDLPLVAAGDVHMARREQRLLQDTVTAIRHVRPIPEVGLSLFPNGERHLRPRERLARIYPAELLEQTLEIARRCTFSLDELRYEYPEELVPAGQTLAGHLRQLTYDGLQRRFPKGPKQDVIALVEKELRLIAELEFEPYFLTVYDLVRFARERGILCQGRGSAANSSVCYALGITEVDPARMSMLFERFLSRERKEPPDIDVDFEHQRREEVIQYIYQKYGRDRAALTAVVISYKPRSAIRDVGKALGLDEDQISRLSAAIQWWDGKQIDPERLEEAGFDPQTPQIRRLMQRVNELIGTPRHLSQHVGGFVIARDKLTRLVPVENARMAERSVIQWEKDDLQVLGLLKVDVLALGMLSALRRALDSLGMQLADIPAEDPKVYDMISQADTIGVFQIESRAQMAMLPRLRPRTFYDLVIQIAIIRPGPIQGDMVHPYLNRRQGKETVSYPSKAIRDVLRRTLGVPIFQEQVMQIAMVAAGFTPGEADQLRRAMAAWKRRGGLEPFRDKLTSGMLARGYSRSFAEQVFKQILGFGEYGFPESHSASFALLAYASSWIKYHHPDHYLCALLNAQPMGFYAPAQLVADAKRHGVEVRPIDVQHSDWDHRLEALEQSDKKATHAIRLGLRMVKGLSQAGATRLATARQTGPFKNSRDLAHRAKLNKADLDALAAADALHSLSGHRHQARWAVTGIEAPLPLEQGQLAKESGSDQIVLPEPTTLDELRQDYSRTGLSLGPHPLTLIRDRLTQQGYRSVAEILTRPHGRLVHAAGLIINRQRPYSADGVIFMTLEDETGLLNIVVWDRISQNQRKTLLNTQLMGIHGTLEKADGVTHLIAGKLDDLSGELSGLESRSRDFH